MVALARRARHVVMAGLAIAGTFIVVLSVWDLFGTLPLPLSVASPYSVNMVNERILSKRRATRSSRGIRKHPW